MSTISNGAEQPKSKAADVRLVPIADIKIDKRIRQDLGDLSELMTSVEEVGLINFPTVDDDMNLETGERRVEACRRLGWTEIHVHVIHSAGDLLHRIQTEHDENLCRKELTPSEMAAMAAKLRPLLAQEAAERKAATQAKPGEQVGRRLHRVGPSEGQKPRSLGVSQRDTPTRPPGRAQDRLAKAVGTSSTTLDKIEEVIEAEEDPDPEIRQVATEAREEMDRTGKVDPAHRRLRQAQSAKSAKRSGSRRSSSTFGAGVAEFTSWIGRVRRWLDTNKPDSDVEVPPNLDSALRDLDESIHPWIDR
jgi:ParB family chromosome partitioning protein